VPFTKDGALISVLAGDTDQERLVNKIREMRKELAHLDRVMASMELQVRRGVPAAAMRETGSLMFNWTISLLESFCQIAKVAYGRDFMLLVVADLRKKLQMFGF